ncbi:MAG TPA: cation:proton antiporter, partial [Nocardioidaceae bacterium]|nr:cation:proton antiporter [Nocardioidaceae bacterium]
VTLGFAEGMAWLAQIGLFVLLGLLASPSRLPDALLPALVVGGGLLLGARPLSVVLCLTPFRVPWREQAFTSWAGLRGAVPIVLATIPLSAGLPGATRIFDVVFLLVVVFTLVQAPALPWLARRLGITRPLDPRGVHIESSPLEDIGGTLLQFSVPGKSRLANVTVEELRLPSGAAVTLILRDGQTMVPEATTTFSAGDHLLVVSTAEAQEAAEHRLRQVSRRGRLASWLEADD